jgi:hypothetical protein
MTEYSKEHGFYPQSFTTYMGYATTVTLIRKLARLTKPPTNLSDFMSITDSRKGIYGYLRRISNATLSKVTSFLPEEGQIITADSPSAISVPNSSDKEEGNGDTDSQHPVGNWIEYSFGQTDHYPVIIDDGDDQVTTNYICYVFDGEENYVKGTNHKKGPIYHLTLHACPQLQPNFDNDKQIRDNHLNVFVKNH